MELLNATTIWLLGVKTATLLAKGYLFARVLTLFYRKSSPTRSEHPRSSSLQIWSLLGLLLFCIMFDDANWIVKLTRRIWFPEVPIQYTLCLARLSWIFATLQYFSLNLLIEKLINKNFSWTLRHYTSAFCGVLVTAYLLYVAIFNFDITQPELRSTETAIYTFILIYLFISLLPSFVRAVTVWSEKKLPVILQHQSKTLLLFLVIPYLVMLLLSYQPFSNFLLGPAASSEFFVGVNSLLMTAAIYFCAWKMLGLRFLQVKNQVEDRTQYNFINDFKDFLAQLGYVTTITELQRLTSTFFQHAFKIAPESTKLYIRDLDITENNQGNAHINIPIIETLLSDHENGAVLKNIAERGILVRDEIEFDNFYEATDVQTHLVQLLKTTDSCIFLPLYEQNTIAAYIVVHANARPNKLFTNTEQNEMLVFAQYMSNVIYLLRHRNLDALIQKEKELKEELYFKHQEIHHYKESIRTLLKPQATHKVGVIYHKNRTFTYGNQTARTMLQGTSAQLTNPLYVTPLKQLIAEAKKYGPDRKTTVRGVYGNPIIFSVCAGSSSTHHTILVYYASITDNFTIPFETLKDLSNWDYAIYLETTKSGQLINQLIPSSTEAMLNFKIELLKCAFSKEPMLLELPEHDLMPVVHILHHVSLRSILHPLHLQHAEQNQEVATQLFGTGPLFSTPETAVGLLSKLSESGTIFIQNIEFLSLDTQQRLLSYLQSGMFRQLKSDRSFSSNVRIICSTSNNLELLAQQGSFSSELLKKLKNVKLSMPSLLTLSVPELTGLAQRLGEQALQSQELTTLVQLNDKETHKLIEQRPTSLHEFKERVHRALMHKSVKQKVDHLVTFDRSYLAEEPDIAEAVKLGKDALKDTYIMNMLWNKFQNQTKIATLLKVNRSSVNRRFKKLNIGQEPER